MSTFILFTISCLLLVSFDGRLVVPHHLACRVFFWEVCAAMMAWLLLSSILGLPNIFALVETYWRLLKVDLSPITIEDEFLYGMTTVG